MAAALSPDELIIHNASPNYMVQDICFFLKKLGVKNRGNWHDNLKITGRKRLAKLGLLSK